jgi:hypothetical protein
MSWQGYDSCMNFSFLSPDGGACIVRLWASGRYGFSLPKKVEITTPAGETHVFLYFNKKVRIDAELSKRAIVNIAIAQYLRGDHIGADVVEIDADTPPYKGTLTSVRPAAPRAPLRVRPGKSHARVKPGETSPSGQAPAALEAAGPSGR